MKIYKLLSALAALVITMCVSLSSAQAQVIKSISIDTPDVYGEQPVIVTLYFTARTAGALGESIHFQISNTNVVSYRPDFKPPAGLLSLKVSLGTYPVLADKVVTIGASMDGVGGKGKVTVHKPVVLGVKFAPASVTGGTSTVGWVTLGSPCPDGFIVDLSSDSESASVPATVTFDPDTKKASFLIATSPVITDTVANVTASYSGSSSASGALTVKAPKVFSLVLTPSNVSGGSAVHGVAYLSGPAPAGGVILNLDASSASVDDGTVTIPGGRWSAGFSLNSHPVTESTDIPLDVTSTTLAGSAEATIHLQSATVRRVTVGPAIVTGGTSAIGKVTLTGPASADGLTVYLFSDNDAVTVPSLVTVLPGETVSTFTVTTKPVATAQTAALLATITDDSTSTGATTTLKVNPPKISYLAFAKKSITGGTSVAGTVTLNGLAPEGGFAIELTADHDSLHVPGGIVYVAPGHSTLLFSATRSAVGSDTVVIGGATSGGVSVTSSITIAAPILGSVNVSPASIKGGTSTTGTVTLMGVAPAGGMLVTLSSDNAAAMVGATVLVPEGATSATFTVMTSTVSTSTTCKITATLGAVTKTKSIVLRP